MKKIKTNYKLKVEFYDVDPMEVVWHGNYLKYIEAARCDMLEKIGYTYMDMKLDNSAYPVAKMDLKYIKPATFGQELCIESTLESVEPAMVINYLIKDVKTGEKILKAKSMQIRINSTTKESLYNADEKFLKKIEEY